jgi:hypothetical protein
VDEEEAIGTSGHRDSGSSENQIQTPFTTEAIEYAEKSQGLPRMKVDGRGFEAVEWTPTPDMYRTDTPEGREAYEASFRIKMKPAGDRVAGRSGDLKAKRSESTVPHEHAEVHAI